MKITNPMEREFKRVNIKIKVENPESFQLCKLKCSE